MCPVQGLAVLAWTKETRLGLLYMKQLPMLLLLL